MSLSRLFFVLLPLYCIKPAGYGDLIKNPKPLDKSMRNWYDVIVIGNDNNLS
jgi:hypothetical protein